MVVVGVFQAFCTIVNKYSSKCDIGKIFRFDFLLRIDDDIKLDSFRFPIKTKEKQNY